MDTRVLAQESREAEVLARFIPPALPKFVLISPLRERINKELGTTAGRIVCTVLGVAFLRSVFRKDRCIGARLYHG